MSDSRVPVWRTRLADASVEGAAVGYGGAPGTFYTLLKEIEGDAQPAEIAELLRDELPQMRSLGIALLAQGDAPEPQRIAEHLCDDSAISYFPGGCVGSSTTVGGFARTMLGNAAALESCMDCDTPLLSPEELWRLDWQLFARDHCPGLSAIDPPDISPPGASPKEDPWPALRRALPRVTTWRLIRAIGRNGRARYDRAGRDQARALLERILEDRPQAPETRLAAASALTRLGNAGSVAILDAQVASLDRIGTRAHGTHLRDTLRKRLSFEARLQPYKQVTTWRENERIAPDVIATFRAFEDEPFIFDELTDAMPQSYGDQTDAVRTALLEVLAKLEQRVAPGIPEWSVEFDLAERIDAFQASERR